MYMMNGSKWSTIKEKAGAFYTGFWGNQWDSNPRPLEPQSNALTS